MSRASLCSPNAFAVPVLAGLVLTTLLTLPVAADTVYFSSLNYTGTPDGTLAHPFTDIAQVPSTLVAGRNVLLERGSSWYSPTLTWDLSNKGSVNGAPMVIGAYGDTSLPRPVVAGLVKDPLSEWRNDGNGVYSSPQYDSTWTQDHVIRVYVGGSPVPKVPGPGSLVEGTYCVSSGRIQVKCNALPGQPFVESLQATPNMNSLIQAANVHNLTISDLDLRGGANWSAMIFTAPTTSVTLERLKLHQIRYYGINFTVSGVNGAVTNQSPTVIDCEVDKGWTSAMNSEYTHVVYYDSDTTHHFQNGAGGGQPFGDGINFGEGVLGGVIRGCFVTNMGHSCIGVEYKDSTLTNQGVRNILIEENSLTAGASSYCRAFGINGSDRSGRIVIRRNHAYDVNVSSSFEADSLFLYSNIFETTNYSTATSGHCAFATPTAIGTGLHWEGSVFRATTNTVIANNTFTDAEYFLSCLNADPSNQLSNLKFANNICNNWGTANMSWGGTPEQCASASAAAFLEGSTVGKWGFLNNGFWDGSSATSLVGIKRSTYPSVDLYGVDSLNGWAGCSGNLRADPLFAGGSAHDPDALKLAANSPFGSAGTSLASLLPQDVEAVDFHGNTFGPTPSLGAHQYPFIGLESARIAGAPAARVMLNTALNASVTLVPANASVQSYAWTLRRGSEVVDSGTQATFARTLATAGSYALSLVVSDRYGYLRPAADINFVVDATPPDSVVMSLAASGRYNIGVNWTAPGDDGAQGQAAAYHVRISTEPFTASNFLTNGYQVDIPDPAVAGTAECAVINYLFGCTNYYVALKTKDVAGNWSAIGRYPAVKTKCSGSYAVDCGGFSAHPVEEEFEAPRTMELAPVHPNPVAGAAIVEYGIPANEQGNDFEVAVFDIVGRRVQTLANGVALPGHFAVQWRGHDSTNAPVRAGVYFIRFRLGEQVQTRVFTMLQ